MSKMPDLSDGGAGDMRSILDIQVDVLEYVERTLAGAFRRQPDMSGDQRKRLLPHELRAVEGCASDIVADLQKAYEAGLLAARSNPEGA